ncbi:MAG: putative manganese-dependent inorganic diphosphatase [Thermoflexaceae bacterium]|nr:putative manganese-dependent inorganic diphosphatase [Thermoflexaceae bacterium]
MDGKKIYVIGHKNPDTDSICSAICYSHLKNEITGSDCYVARRAGEINQETRYVLNRFRVTAPAYIDDVSPQVKDIDIRRVPGVDDGISLKKAWYLMKSTDVVTLPVLNGDKLAGLITIGDIANSYMDIYDNRILSTAKTPYINIIETLDGELITGSSDSVFEKGKVLVAAANPELMENYIEAGDLVILGNRYETQLCAIEMGAGCMIVCEGAKVSLTIKKLAEQNGCTIICSPHDTYTVARLINQSMPIRYFMRKENLITFKTETLVDDIKQIMASVRHRDFPVLTRTGKYVGMISRRNLLGMERKKVILVDHNEKSQAVDGISEAVILEIIDHHRLGSLETVAPVFFRNQPLGCTATIIYQLYKENGVTIEKTIAGLLCCAIISDTLMFRSPTCTEADKAAARDLAAIAQINIEEMATGMFAAGSDFANKTDEEIFYQDFKKFSSGQNQFGVGQISSMSREELENIKQRIVPYIKKNFESKTGEMIFFMLTNVMETSSELIYYGNGAEGLVMKAFGVNGSGDSVYIKGLVSRKKQLIPELILAMQE